MQTEQNEFMQHELRLPELTVRGMILGAILTVIFTASNVYLGLKVGLTFSSAIPAAVISMAILKMAKDSNILENNMVQTQASAARRKRSRKAARASRRFSRAVRSQVSSRSARTASRFSARSSRSGFPSAAA